MKINIFPIKLLIHFSPFTLPSLLSLCPWSQVFTSVNEAYTAFAAQELK